MFRTSSAFGRVKIGKRHRIFVGYILKIEVPSNNLRYYTLWYLLWISYIISLLYYGLHILHEIALNIYAKGCVQSELKAMKPFKYEITRFYDCFYSSLSTRHI